MKALICSWLPLVKNLGTPQTLIDLGNELTRRGWKIDVLGPKEIGLNHEYDSSSYSAALAKYLKKHSNEYDVVEYDHAFLPFARSEFPREPVFIARAQLLVHQLHENPYPIKRGFLSTLKHIFFGWKNRMNEEAKLKSAQITLEEADRVIVLNDKDRDCLISHGIQNEKLAVIPNGLELQHMKRLQSNPVDPPKKPCIGFIGTFDYRKGALDFPKIISQIVVAVPEIEIKLLGTAGLFQTENEVRSFFPASLQPSLKIVTKYSPHELAEHLQPCSVGIFPSYVEGFGLGVLEMLAASIPVIAYDVPGPPMILTKEYLTQAGNTGEMANKAILLIKNPEKLRAARIWAHTRARSFTIEHTAKMTSDFYQSAVAHQNPDKA